MEKQLTTGKFIQKNVEAIMARNLNDWSVQMELFIILYPTLLFLQIIQDGKYIQHTILLVFSPQQ